jgi:uncharacterized protein YbbC (DUF1343 family)
VIGYSPLSYYDTQSFVAPGIHRLVEEIKATWQSDVEKFKAQRRPYLLYAE